MTSYQNSRHRPTTPAPPRRDHPRRTPPPRTSGTWRLSAGVVEQSAARRRRCKDVVQLKTTSEASLYADTHAPRTLLLAVAEMGDRTTAKWPKSG